MKQIILTLALTILLAAGIPALSAAEVEASAVGVEASGVEASAAGVEASAAGIAASTQGVEAAQLAEQELSMNEILGQPDILNRGPCSAQVDCGDGNTIMCNGNNSCQANSYVGRVTCDGQTTYCPNQCQVFLYCECTFINCISTSGNCSTGGGTISCDGNTFDCTLPDSTCGNPRP